MGTRCYKYGLLAPITNGDQVRAQLRHGHEYMNDRIAIERGRRAHLRDVYDAYGPPPDLEAALARAKEVEEEIVKRIREHKIATRSRQVPPAWREELAAARVRTSEARVSVTAAKKDARNAEAIRAERERIAVLESEMTRSARANTAAYWGTGGLMDRSARQLQQAMPLWEAGAPCDPRFRRWSGEGRIGVQVQNGIDCGDVFGSDTRLRIAPVDPLAWTSPIRGDRRRRARTTLSIRIGSTSDRGPVFAEFPMTMHRPLPPHGRIKEASVHLTKIGPRERWHVVIVVDEGESVRAGHGVGTLAVDLGWRVLDRGIRVAVGWDGECLRSFVVPSEVRDSIELPNELQARREANFNVAREGLLRGLREATDLPEWLQTATRFLPQWKSSARLAGLARRWKQQRFEGDAGLFERLEAWRYHDHHLWEWECSQRSKARGHRDELVKTWAADMARTYDTLILEKFDLRRFCRIPSETVEQDEAGHEAFARRVRAIAAPSRLRAALVNAFAARGGTVVTVSAVDSTRTCHFCGSVAEVAIKPRCHTCSGCGQTWDQDENAARNLFPRSPAPAADADARSPKRKIRYGFKAGHVAARAASESGAATPAS